MKLVASRMVLIHDGTSHRWIPTSLIDPESNSEDSVLEEETQVLPYDSDIIYVHQDGRCPNCRRVINVAIIETEE